MVRGRFLSAVATVLLVITGCAIDQTITLEEDLSGQAVLELEVDLEQMMTPFLALAPDEASKMAMRDGMLESQRKEMTSKVEQIEKDLPAGIVASVETREEGLRTAFLVTLAFEHLSLLEELRSEDGSRMFDLDVVDENGLLELTFDAFPEDKDDPDGKSTAGSNAMFGADMPGFSFSAHVEAPFPIVEHNGSEQKGQRVSWRITLDEWQAMKAEGGEPPKPRIVFRRGPQPKPVPPGDIAGALTGKNRMAFARIPVGKAYDLSVTEVTQRQWRKVMGGKPAQCAAGCGRELPVQNVSWIDAARFANRLSELEGVPSCYVIDGTKVGWPDGEACAGYRLPTATKWRWASAGERAARATTGASAWHGGNSGGTLHEVGTKQANAWGLHDLHGNAAEWVWDAVEGDREAHGGSFADALGSMIKPAGRRYPPSVGQAHVGFRLARSVP